MSPRRPARPADGPGLSRRQVLERVPGPVAPTDPTWTSRYKHTSHHCARRPLKDRISVLRSAMASLPRADAALGGLC